MASSAVFSGLAGILAWVLKWMLKKENKKLDANPAEVGSQRYVW